MVSLTQDQHLHSSKDRASAENPRGFPADLARSFPVYASTFSSASHSSDSGKKQKCQNTSKEVIQGAFLAGLKTSMAGNFTRGALPTEINFQLTLYGLAVQALNLC